MPFAETAAAITSMQAALNIVKAMFGLRDEEMMRTKTLELQEHVSNSLIKSIEAREAQSEQLDTIRRLEKEVAELKDWSSERPNYQRRLLWRGGTVYMLKPESRGEDPPHWLCPNCFDSGTKSYFQPRSLGSDARYACVVCRSEIVVSPQERPRWMKENPPDA